MAKLWQSRRAAHQLSPLREEAEIKRGRLTRRDNNTSPQANKNEQMPVFFPTKYRDSDSPLLRRTLLNFVVYVKKHILSSNAS